MGDMIKNGVHASSREEKYVWPTDPLIRERLEWFQDQKLALFIHWGPCSQIGIDSSWALSDGDAHWSRKGMDWEPDPVAFRAQYHDMAKCFNPIRFNPDKWADFALENGFKYLLFTTKHHDGFCLFDTKYTDYKITGEDCPFHTHKYANITKEVFNAFRERGIAIAAYFSKPDWHCPYFWAEGMENPVAFNRYPTYSPAEHPELWEKFIEFTHGQIMELMEDYGRIDILWLDGGWVKPSRGTGIRMSELLAKARKLQPWLISADRTVGDENENYITPEQCIPDHIIKVPWESCITVGTQWAYKYSDTYKSSRTLVHMLIDTVSKGGNLVLDIGPQPNGELPLEAVTVVQGMGAWLKVNGDAIYGTRATDEYESEKVRFTKKGDSIYALVPLEEGEALSDTLLLPIKQAVHDVTYLGDGEKVPFKSTADGLELALPNPICGADTLAAVFKIDL